MTESPVSKSNYPGNSHRERAAEPEEAERRVVKPVVTTEVIRGKKPMGRRIKEYFTGDDARSVGQYLLFDVLLPAAKDTISDVFIQGIQRSLYGDSDRSRRSGGRSGYTSYNKMYSGRGYEREREPSSRREVSDRARSRHEFDEIIIPSRGEAEEVLDQLIFFSDKYGWATVNDFYSLVGITGTFVDDKWGWDDLRDARIIRARDGYVVNLPRTQSIP